MSQQFAQISDPHLSSLAAVQPADLRGKRVLGYISWQRRRRFEHRREVLAALQRDLGRFHFDQLLVTGDLTHVGLPQEFREAREWLERLGEPAAVAVVPGNHDAYVGADWGETFELWRDYMASDAPDTGRGEPFPSLRVRGEVAFVGISTACPKPPLMATGTAGARQLAQLRELLADAARKRLFRVVYLHHSPLPGDERWRKRLTDAPALRDVLVEEGAEMIVHGHGHRGSLTEVETCHGPAPVIAVPSASALGLHGADRAHYNHYTVAGSGEGWRLEIETRGYDPGSRRFSAVDRNRIDLPRRY